MSCCVWLKAVFISNQYLQSNSRIIFAEVLSSPAGTLFAVLN